MFLDTLRGLFKSTPEQKARVRVLKSIATSSAYYDAISKHVGPDHCSEYDDTIRRELVGKLSLQWLTNHARDIFPRIDELEVESDWVINHPDHSQRNDHQRFTLRQLRVWIDTQKHSVK